MAEYDKIARFYDAIFADIFPYDEEARALHRIFQENGSSRVRQVLDASCGTGSHLLRLARLGYECTGSDISPGMLAVARTKAQKEGLRIDYVEQDIKNLTMDRTFDAIISIYGLPLMLVAEHAELSTFQEGLIRALKGIHRLLNEGGKFVFNIINAESPLPYSGFGPWSESNIQGLEKDGMSLVLLNKIRRNEDLMVFKDVYLVQENGKLSIEILDYCIWLPRLDHLLGILETCSFQVSAVYSQLATLAEYNPQSLDVTIVSRKKG